MFERFLESFASAYLGKWLACVRLCNIDYDALRSWKYQVRT